MGSRPPGIVVGLSAEARIARRLGWPVEAGGGTAAGAAEAAARLVGRGVAGLVSFGLAGGLDPALPAGAVIVPATVVVDGERWPTDTALSAAVGGGTGQALLAGEKVAATVADKARAFAASGCAAIDLESGAVARAARAAGLPFAALRVVCDPAMRDLPPAALVALNPSGGAIGPLRILRSLAANPGQIGALLTLAGDAARARRALLERVRTSAGS